MPFSENRTGNLLLHCLTDADLALLEPHLEKVVLTSRKRLQSSNRTIETVYFPDDGLGSVVAIGKGRRAQAEVALIGREGMTGLPIVHGTTSSPYEIFMQVEGEGRQILAVNLSSAMRASSTMRDVFLHYSQAFAIQSGYTALANAWGTLEERLARWLIMAQDRLERSELVLTHELLGLMLGVRRAGVSVALNHFASKCLTRSDRGSVTILDREGLEETANGLYGLPEAEYERLLFRCDQRKQTVTPHIAPGMQRSGIDGLKGL